MMLLVLTAAALGGVGRRALGGAVRVKRWVPLSVMALMAGMLSLPVTGPVLASGIAACAVVYWAMGHGSYMDMGLSPERDNERFVEWLDKWFGPELEPSTLRDFTGMVLRYSLPAVPIAVGYVLAGQYWGLLLPVVGLAIATAYLVFSLLKDRLPHTPVWFDGYTSYGELAAGALFYGALAALL